MSDDDFNDIMSQLGMDNRRRVVASLLAGNDTQCFTAQQYAESYHKICHKDDPEHKENWIKYLIELAPKHLKSVGFIEVKLGVWAKRTPQ